MECPLSRVKRRQPRYTRLVFGEGAADIVFDARLRRLRMRRSPATRHGL